MNLLLRLCCKKFTKHVIVLHSWSINTLKHLRHQWETESFFKASGLWAESLRSQLGSVMLGYPLGKSGRTSSFVGSFTSVHAVLGSSLNWVPFSAVSEMWWQPPSYLAILISGSLFLGFPFLPGAEELQSSVLNGTTHIQTPSITFSFLQGSTS